jgi:hypothetical protein
MAWTPVFSAAVAHEAAMSPPHFRMEIRIQALHNWAHWRDASVEHLRPAPKVLENADENTRQEVAICMLVDPSRDGRGVCGNVGQEGICCKVKWGWWKTSRGIQGYTSVTVSQVN